MMREVTFDIGWTPDLGGFTGLGPLPTLFTKTNPPKRVNVTVRPDPVSVVGDIAGDVCTVTIGARESLNLCNLLECGPTTIQVTVNPNTCEIVGFTAYPGPSLLASLDASATKSVMLQQKMLQVLVNIERKLPTIGEEALRAAEPPARGLDGKETGPS